MQGMFVIVIEVDALLDLGLDFGLLFKDHKITMYLSALICPGIKNEPQKKWTPRTIMIGGKVNLLQTLKNLLYLVHSCPSAV